MNLTTAYAAGRLTVCLHGELDHYTAREAMRGVIELLDEYLPRECVLDLSGLRFMEPLFTTGGEERSGMGFAIMQSFTDSLSVRSLPGKGTTVRMRRRIFRRGRGA